MVQDLQREVRELKAANPFTPMGMYPKAGGLEVNGFIHSLRSADGSLSLSLDSAADAFIAYDAAGNDMVRIGKMAHVNPGVYGVEVKYNGSWLQVGGGNVDWGNISNKPATYAPSATATLAVTSQAWFMSHRSLRARGRPSTRMSQARPSTQCGLATVQAISSAGIPPPSGTRPTSESTTLTLPTSLP
jgi:hypothetical protein